MIATLNHGPQCPLGMVAKGGRIGMRNLEALAPYRLFSQQGLALHLLPGAAFAPVAEAVGRLRESTYRQQLAGSGQACDLDSRDPHYDHFLLLDESSGELAGAARLQFVPRQSSSESESPTPTGQESYLEHVYPGIKALLAQQTNSVEIGRVALAPRFQRQPHSLMCLFRGALQVAVGSGYNSIHGLVSYNHFAFSEATNIHFLSSLLRPPFLDTTNNIPPARHPVSAIQPTFTPGTSETIQQLERDTRQRLDPNFHLPILLRQYINLMHAKVNGLSLARDFNQITEILMTGSLDRIPRGRLNYFVDFAHQPVYQKFPWYRGD